MPVTEPTGATNVNYANSMPETRRARVCNAAAWRPRPSTLAAALAALALAMPVAAQVADLRPETLAGFSLEDLANVEITSVSGRAEPLSDAPASVYVITNADIRRAGVTSLPEALRLAPNLEVARTTASTWAISARGMNNADNKLQVLIDGRIVYTPLYSGVLWDAQDVLLEDVDRIEVISGPGGTLWGSNAVNGVINIITRSAADTQGSFAEVGGGDQEQDVAARYGGKLGDSGHFRLYAKAFHDDGTQRVNGQSAMDAWKKAQIGFRADWSNGITLQGDAYDGRLDQVFPDDQRISGANAIFRWSRALAGGDALQVQAYADHSELDVPGRPGLGTLAERLDIYDVELQYNVRPLGAHTLTWGAGYRFARDRVDNPPVLAFLPADVDLAWTNVFVQDVVALGHDATLTGGVRAEHNSYTGFEVFPTLRASWKPAAGALLWAGASRAVRTPSRLDRDLYSPAVPPYLIAGGPQFRSETSDVLELGLRAQPATGLSFSLTAFRHIYEHLRSVELIDNAYFVVANQMEGNASGVEGWVSWRVTPAWKLSAGGTTLRQRLNLRADSTDITGVSAAGNDPSNQWVVRSSLDLPHEVDLDMAVRHVAALPDPAVPAYTAFDARIAWRPRRDVELSVTGQNLFGTQHVEFGASPGASVIPRSVFVNLAVRL
jgi:iron complex outermembrane receptor protein